MRRRDLIKGTAAGLVITAWPLASRAQATGNVPKVGFLGTNATAWRPWTDAFEARLRELGWTAGRTVTIEYRWAEGRRDRYIEFAAEFVRLAVDVIVTPSSAVPAIVQATSTIPVVFALSADPLGAGLVKSLARPGGNVHRRVERAGRYCQQTPRAVARGRPRSASIGRLVQCEFS